ncbi:MAG: hypothetical protein ACI8P3_002653, partial [Saprospiraceae bacterium]
EIGFSFQLIQHFRLRRTMIEAVLDYFVCRIVHVKKFSGVVIGFALWLMLRIFVIGCTL